MTKKNRKKKNVQSVEPEVAGVNEPPIEAEQAKPQTEPVNVDLDAQETIIENPNNEDLKEEVAEAAIHEGESDAPEVDMDDILADVRHSLIEEDEADKSGKKSNWWNRLVKGSSNQEAPDVELPIEAEKDLSVVAAPAIGEPDEKETGEYVEQIDELIKLLETDTVEEQEDVSDIPVQAVSLPPEPEVPIDVDELKKQAFSPRPMDEKSDEFSEVRQVALGGDEEVFVEVETKAEDPLDERIKAVENALRPYRSYIYYVLAFIGVIMAVMASVLMYNAYKQSLPPEVTEVVNLPYPVTLTIPGGLNFNLGKGTLKDGDWNPRGPEWLEGTEICRWVALPWSRQLEAAIRTMNREDVLELKMSNNDRLSYQVESIQQLTPAEMQEMDSGTPCLALILAEQDSEKRWVVIGRP